MMTEPPVNAFTAQHGMYRQETIAVTAGEFDDSEPTGNVRVTRNRAVTTVERWKAAGDLDEAEAEAISLYCRAWHAVFSEPRVSMNWSLTATIKGMPADNYLDAIDALQFLKDCDEWFGWTRKSWLNVWQSIVIYDWTANAAGGFVDKHKARETSAKRIVQFFAGIIASRLRLGPC